MIKIEQLTKIYKVNRKKHCCALNNVSFVLPDRGMVFIVGKSGSGKSTLLNLLGGLDKPTSGQIFSDNIEITKLSGRGLTKYRSSYVGFVFQDYHVIDKLTVEENVTLTLNSKNEDYSSKVDNILNKLEIQDLKNRFPKELSGGQKQRVAIARALVKDSSVLLCDEPSGNLDKKTTKALLETLKEISNEKLVVIVSHSIRDAEVYGDRIIELADGEVVRDRKRTNNYSNEFRIEESKVYLPHYRDLEENEIDVLNKAIEENNNLEFIQVNNKFIETKDVLTNNRCFTLKQEKISRKAGTKFFKIFFTKKLNMIINVFLAAIILVCFAIFQSFLAFDGNKALSDSLKKNNIKSLPLTKTIEGNSSTTSTGKMDIVLDNELQAFIDAGYEGKIYKKYNSTLPINVSYTSIDCEYGINVINNLYLFYIRETFGTINCDEEYLASIYGVDGEVVYIAKCDVPKDYGVYIPDYIADSMIKFSLGKYKTYDDLLGLYKYHNYQYGYINGIFDTNYEVKYSEIITKINEILESPDIGSVNYSEISNSPLFVDFCIEAMNSLAYGYNFSEDYEKAVDTNEFRNWVHLTRVEVSKNDEEFDFLTDGFTAYNANATGKYTYLTGNQIIMSTHLYNKIFHTSYATDMLDNFVPHKVYIKIYENYESSGRVMIEEEFEVVGLYKNSSSPALYTNSDKLSLFRKYDIVNYGIVLDSHDHIEKMIEVASANNFVVGTSEASKLSVINQVLDIFGDFFVLIEVFFLCIAIVFLINMGISSVKKSRYEIGVLKAIGIRNFDIIKSFFLQSLILAVSIAIISNIGIYIGTQLANFILIKAFEEVLGVVINDLVLIDYIPVIVIQDLVNIMIISIVSFIIPQLVLLRIKPIDIIRARE